MRMMKRLAVCVLAAAMSLTMLTACGDDTPSAPETPSNPGTSQGSGSGDSGNSGNSSGQNPGGAENGGSNTGTVAWLASKTYKYNKILQGNKIYMKANYRIMEGEENQVVDYVYNQDMAKAYMETILNGMKESVLLADNWAYVVVPEGKIIKGEKIGLKIQADDFEQQELNDKLNQCKVISKILLTPGNTSEIKAEKKTLAGTTYDTESYTVTYEGSSANVTTYYLGGVLKYVIAEDSTAQIKIRFDEINESPKANLLKPAADYTFYTVDSQGNVYDENGVYLGNLSQD